MGYLGANIFLLTPGGAGGHEEHSEGLPLDRRDWGEETFVETGLKTTLDYCRRL